MQYGEYGKFIKIEMYIINKMKGMRNFLNFICKILRALYRNFSPSKFDNIGQELFTIHILNLFYIYVYITLVHSSVCYV